MLTTGEFYAAPWATGRATGSSGGDQAGAIGTLVERNTH
jgi:hypothetical protein